MTHRAPAFSGGTKALIDPDRLAALKAKVDEIATDLSTLEGMTQGARQKDQALLDQVIVKFAGLGDV